MNKQAFTTLEYQHLLELIKRNAQTEPGQRRVERLAPIDDVSELRRELAALAECVRLRSRGVKWWFNGLTDPAETMNEKLLGSNHLGIKRFFALDTQAYEDGALDKKTKELMGLVASAVLRCDDCITYHVKQCASIGVNREEFLDAFNVALVVGGSITIPHLRRAIDRVDQLLETGSQEVQEI